MAGRAEKYWQWCHADLGSELGGGIIVHHQLLHGSHYQAGEVSFLPFKHQAKNWGDFTGQQCSAVNMIVKVNTALGINDKYDGRAAFAAINAHDPKAWPLFVKFCRSLAYTILTIQAILDGEKLSLRVVSAPNRLSSRRSMRPMMN